MASSSYSYGDATIDFREANLANANLSGSVLTARGEASATIDFSEASLTNADLSSSFLTAGSFEGHATIDFTHADLASSDLSGWRPIAAGNKNSTIVWPGSMTTSPSPL